MLTDVTYYLKPCKMEGSNEEALSSENIIYKLIKLENYISSDDGKILEIFSDLAQAYCYMAKSDLAKDPSMLRIFREKHHKFSRKLLSEGDLCWIPTKHSLTSFDSSQFEGELREYIDNNFLVNNPRDKKEIERLSDSEDLSRGSGQFGEMSRRFEPVDEVVDFVKQYTMGTCCE